MRVLRVPGTQPSLAGCLRGVPPCPGDTVAPCVLCRSGGDELHPAAPVPSGVHLPGHRGPLQQQAPQGPAQGHPQERHRAVSAASRGSLHPPPLCCRVSGVRVHPCPAWGQGDRAKRYPNTGLSPLQPQSPQGWCARAAVTAQGPQQPAPCTGCAHAYACHPLTPLLRLAPPSSPHILLSRTCLASACGRPRWRRVCKGSTCLPHTHCRGAAPGDPRVGPVGVQMRVRPGSPAAGGVLRSLWVQGGR